MQEARPKGLAFVSAYVDDFDKAFTFYSGVLGLEKQYDMGPKACFFKLGKDWGLYLEGGSTLRATDPKSSRASFTLSVDSAGAFFQRLKEAGVETIQAEPMDMGQGDYWFQFRDSSGNILEALGGK
jgi:predicted enzyme related to lactoylglutathione lyase